MVYIYRLLPKISAESISSLTHLSILFLLSSPFLSHQASSLPARSATSRPSTSLSAWVDEKEMTADQKKMTEIAQKWKEVRMMSVDEVEDPEWKEAHIRFYEKYNSDMEKMQEIAVKVQKLIEPPKVEKKTKGQRKRDAFAKKQARAAARAK